MRTETLTVAGCATQLRRGGGGAPLLVLHGEAGDTWSPWHARLAQRFTVIAPDHPGFGGSATPDWFDNIHDLAFFHLSLLEQLGLNGVHLLGNGLGGWVAAELAVRDASRLASLVLCNAPGVQVKGAGGLDPFLLTPEEEAQVQRHDLAAPQDDDTRLKNRFAFARMAWAPRLHDPHLEKWLHRVRVPTLVLAGAEDPLVVPAVAARYAERIPGARLRLLPGCGHRPELEQPDAFCDHLETFIAEVAP